jgi:predicted transcriptional regulator
MPRTKRISLTTFELEVMEALWALGSASVRQLQESLPARKQVAYTTVQTIVNRLEEKGVARRARKIGNALIFEPAVTKAAVQRRLIDEFLGLVGGARPLVAYLVESGKLSLEDVREVEESLDRVAREREAGKGKRP